MSLIGKKPFLQKIFENLTEQQLTTLSGLIDNPGNATFVSLLQNEHLISDANKGVSHVKFQLNETNTVEGFLCYIDRENCGLFTWQNDFEKMESIQIDPVDRTNTYLQEHLHAEEFRRAIDDFLEISPGGVDAWTKKMKEVLDYDEENHVIENGTDVYIDGTLEVDDEAKFNDHFSVFADNGSRMIDANTANKTTSLYGTVNVGSTETATPLNVRGTSSFYGNVHNESGFIETNELKVNQIKVQNTPEGQRPTVNVTNADLSIGALGGTRKLLLNGGEIVPATYQTTAPTEAITDGGVHIVYLESEPATKYNGYIYLIKA